MAILTKQKKYIHMFVQYNFSLYIQKYYFNNKNKPKKETNNCLYDPHNLCLVIVTYLYKDCS